MKPCREFTLIELLLVVAIILILVSMLLPVLSKLENVAYGVQCKANMRQIAASFLVYEGDYNGFCPSKGEGEEYKNHTQVKLNDLYIRPKSPLNPNNQREWNGVFRCKAYFYRADADSINGTVSDAGIGLHQGAEGFSGRKLQVVVNPSTKLMAIDWMASWLGGGNFVKTNLSGSNVGMVPGTMTIPQVTIGAYSYSWPGARKDFIEGRHATGSVNVLYFDGSTRESTSIDVGRHYYTPVPLPGRAIHRWAGYPNGVNEAANNMFNPIAN